VLGPRSGYPVNGSRKFCIDFVPDQSKGRLIVLILYQSFIEHVETHDPGQVHILPSPSITITAQVFILTLTACIGHHCKDHEKLPHVLRALATLQSQPTYGPNTHEKHNTYHAYFDLVISVGLVTYEPLCPLLDDLMFY
jgi:hypothetical protein